MGSRRKARECALQMLFAADVAETPSDEVVRTYWAELGESELDDTVPADRSITVEDVLSFRLGSGSIRPPTPTRSNAPSAS